MSFASMIERARLDRLPDEATCMAVIITGTARYEQDPPYGFYTNVRNAFPTFPASDEDFLEWSDRIIDLR